MLKDIPIDVLKIDQGFLRETEDSTRLAIIFAAVAQMAKDLAIDVVVEGVETSDNVDLMKHNGCLIAQGFYFARPMEPADF
ncbi:MAG: EAL domain-containing protein, partial [Raoultibacter sp.]